MTFVVVVVCVFGLLFNTFLRICATRHTTSPLGVAGAHTGDGCSEKKKIVCANKELTHQEMDKFKSHFEINVPGSKIHPAAK